MNEPYVSGTKQIYLQLDNAIKFIFSRIKVIESFFIAEINEREKREKTLNKTLQKSIDITLPILSGQVVLFLVSHILLSLVHLLG